MKIYQILMLANKTKEEELKIIKNQKKIRTKFEDNMGIRK